MCLFTHFAAGAFLGGASGHAGAAVGLGLVSHAALDALPHYDFPDWRVELAGGLGLLLLLALSPVGSGAAIAGGVAGMVPDLENLLEKLGKMKKRAFLFPSHTGLIPHGRELGPRTLVWQVVLAAVLLAGLGLAAPTGAGAQELATPPAGDPAPRMDLPVTEVLRADERATVIRIRFPVAVAPADWSALDPATLDWGASRNWHRTADGGLEPAPPRAQFTLAVPTAEPVDWQVLETTWWRPPAADPDPLALVTVAPPALFREVPLVHVGVLPLAAPGGVLSSLTVSVSHPPAGRPGRALAAGKAAAGEPGEEAAAVPAGVANGTLFGQLARGGRRELARAVAADAAAKDAVTAPFALTSNWIRREIESEGIYTLEGIDLGYLGVDEADLDPATLRLYRGGGLALAEDPELPDAAQLDRIGLNEVAIEVRDPDGTWDSADRIIFYAFGADCWRDRLVPGAARLEHHEHPYTPRAVYWLTWENYGTGSPLPGTPRRVTPAARPAIGGATPLSTQLRREHFEQRSSDALGLVADNWLWDSVIAGSKQLGFVPYRPVAGASAMFLFDVVAMVKQNTWSTAVAEARVWLNDDTAHTAVTQWQVSEQGHPDSTRIRVAGWSSDLRTGTNVLHLENHNVGVSDLGLDSFDVLYPSELAKAVGVALPVAHWGVDVPAPGTPYNLAVTHVAAEDVLVWDVSRPDSAVQVVGDETAGPGTLRTVTLGLERDPGSDVHLVFFDADDALKPPVEHRRRYVPTPLREVITPADYVVVYDPRFATAAARLAAHRNAHLAGVAGNPRAIAVNEEDIYDNFSGGLKDVFALRNFLRWLYRHPDDPGRLRYVCWLGDASRDWRNNQNRDPDTQLYDFVPTYLWTNFPGLPYWRGVEWTYYPFAMDDGLVSFDDAAYLQDLPDLASGRLTVGSAAEAMAAVQKIIDYETAPPAGRWRNSVTFCADDLLYPKEQNENYHTVQAEVLAHRYLPASLDMQKVYLVDFKTPPGASYKPGARLEARRRLNDGTTLFHYIGHGSNLGLADEQVLLNEDIRGLVNGDRRCLFTAFSCDVGIYDSPTTQSMAEVFVSHAGGGAIAAVCAAQVSWVGPNNLLSNAFYANLYPGRRVIEESTVGEALLFAKVDNGVANWRNNLRYLLFGDPALHLAQPLSADFLAPDFPDTLHGGNLERIVCDLSSLDIGPGASYDVRVQEAGEYRYDSHVYYPGAPIDYTPYLAEVWYWGMGAAVFRNAGSVRGDRLEVPFKMPIQLRYGRTGKVTVVVDDGERSYAASDSLPVVSVPLPPSDDFEGPAIALSFAEQRYRVHLDTPLFAAIEDSSGVSIVGTRPGNSILLELDDSGFLTDFSEQFRFDQGSYTQGEVTLSLPGDLELGPHKVAVHASDNLGNVGSDTLSFLLVAEGIAGIESDMVFPNPTPGPCRLAFELSDPMEVDWSIYTLAGRRIARVRDSFATGGPQVLSWDGRDSWGDEIANGVYLYVLRGSWRGNQGRDIQRTGQIVIMR